MADLHLCHNRRVVVRQLQCRLDLLNEVPLPINIRHCCLRLRRDDHEFEFLRVFRRLLRDLRLRRLRRLDRLDLCLRLLRDDLGRGQHQIENQTLTLTTTLRTMYL